MKFPALEIFALHLVLQSPSHSPDSHHFTAATGHPGNTDLSHTAGRTGAQVCVWMCVCVHVCVRAHMSVCMLCEWHKWAGHMQPAIRSRHRISLQICGLEWIEWIEPQIETKSISLTAAANGFKNDIHALVQIAEPFKWSAWIKSFLFIYSASRMGNTYGSGHVRWMLLHIYNFNAE